MRSYHIAFLVLALALSQTADAKTHKFVPKHRPHIVVSLADNPLALSSSSAFLIDQETNEVLFERNTSEVGPIASITKLMTGVVIAEAQLPMDEMITITSEDLDFRKHTGSRLAVGTQLTRGDALALALMASENRAANSLGRTFPGGLATFVEAMNKKAADLGMADTAYEEPTGLSNHNRSSARDLAVLVKYASTFPLIRAFTTTPRMTLHANGRELQFHNTNPLVSNDSWQIGLQKTGFINEAGRCLVMQMAVAGRNLIMVVLHSHKPGGRIADAEKLRRFVVAKAV